MSKKAFPSFPTLELVNGKSNTQLFIPIAVETLGYHEYLVKGDLDT